MAQIILVSLFIYAGFAVQQLPEANALPEPFATPSVNNSPRVVPRPPGAELRLPAGFSVNEWAEGFARPRFMVSGPGGEVLLSDAIDEGKVWVLRDTNHDGVAETRKVLVEGLYRPYGMAFRRNELYIAGTMGIQKWLYDPQSCSVSGPATEVASWPEFKRGHWTRTILFSAGGDRFFVTVGSASNVDAGEDPRRAAVNLYSSDGSQHSIFASGLRNAVGMRFHPATNDLWVTVQERDALGDDLVPDYFTRVKQGEFFGWPFAYIGPNEDPRRKGEKPDLVAATRIPDVLLPAHSAVLDFIFYSGGNFPPRYQGGAFLAYHGSWNRAERTGYKIVFVPFSEGEPSGPPEDFLTGWMTDPKSREVWGRPVGLLQLPDGSLLISDDGANKIWRVTFD